MPAWISPDLIEPLVMLHCITLYLDPINQKAVNDVDGNIIVQDGEEQGEEPAEGDHGQNL